MSGQWEQYVEQAALAMHRERFGPDVPWGEFGPVMEEMERAEARAVLEAVGPLIAEDTRTRLVEAAARAVEREMCPSCGTPPGGRHDDFCTMIGDEDWADGVPDSVRCSSPGSNQGDGRGCDDHLCPRHGGHGEGIDD